MKSNILIRSIIVTLIAVAVAFAQDPTNQRSGGEVSRVGTAAGQFLKIGIGARAAAMGEAMVPIAGDVSSLYWNPSGIASIKRTSALASRIDFIAGIRHNFFGLVHPLNQSSAIGVSVTSLNSGDIEITTIDEPGGTGAFYDVNNLSLGISYARFLTDRFQIGITAKLVQEGIYREKARTVAVDIGSILNTGLLGIKLGIALTNFGGEMRLSGPDLERDFADRDNPQNPSVDAELQTDKWPLPLSFRVGLATDLVGRQGQFFDTPNNRLTVLADFVDSNDALLRSNWGVEYGLYDILFLRGGYHGLILASDLAKADFNFSTYETASYTLGAGLRYDFGWGLITVDYALSDYGRLDNFQQFTIAIGF